MPQNVIIDNKTKVGELTRAIDIWQKIEKTSSSPEEKRIARENLQKQTQAKAELVNIIESKLGKLSEESRYKISGYIGDTSKNRYDNLSIEILNKYLDSKDQVDYMEQENPSDSLGMQILEGKTGVDYMTVVKSTLAVSAVSLLAQAGTFSALSSGLSALMAFNPVVGACAVVLGTASLIRMARKIFAPEIKKITSNVRVQEKFEQLSAESGEQYNLYDFDAYRKGYSENTNAETKPFTKPGDQYDKSKFDNYRQQIIDEAYNATKNGETYNPPYGQNIISDDEITKCVAKGIEKAHNEKAEEERAAAEKEAREKAEAEKEAKEKAETEETPKKPEIVTAKMVNKAEEETKKAKEAQRKAEEAYNKAEETYKKAKEAYENKQDAKTTKAFEEASNNLNKCESELETATNAMNVAENNLLSLRAKFNEHVGYNPTGPATITPKTPVAEPKANPTADANAEQKGETPTSTTEKTQTNTTGVDPEAKNTTQQTNTQIPANKETAEEKKKTTAEIYNEVEGGIDRTKKANGQGKDQQAYDNFMKSYHKILRNLNNGYTQIHLGKNKPKQSATQIITQAGITALDKIQDEKLRKQCDELFLNLSILVEAIEKEIKNVNNNTKTQSQEIVRRQLTEAGFTKEQIEEQLRSPEQQ